MNKIQESTLQAIQDYLNTLVPNHYEFNYVLGQNQVHTLKLNINNTFVCHPIMLTELPSSYFISLFDVITDKCTGAHYVENESEILECIKNIYY